MSLSVYLECKSCHMQLYTAEVTHNLGEMAKYAQVYDAMWSPQKLNIEKASDLIPILEKGLHLLESEPDDARRYNPDNGWGNYEEFTEFTRNYLNACKEYPDASIRIYR
jgi:hypothetical protein